jgi:mono/diheme cytochrome c family protein
MTQFCLVVVAGVVLVLACKRDKPAASVPRVEEPAAESAKSADSSPEVSLAASRHSVQGCSKCHKDDGTGGQRGPDLTDSEWLHCDGSVEGIHSVLLSGVAKDQLKDANRPFGMNPVTHLVPDDADVKALAEYIKSLSTE